MIFFLLAAFWATNVWASIHHTHYECGSGFAYLVVRPKEKNISLAGSLVTLEYGVGKDRHRIEVIFLGTEVSSGASQHIFVSKDHHDFYFVDSERVELDTQTRFLRIPRQFGGTCAAHATTNCILHDRLVEKGADAAALAHEHADILKKSTVIIYNGHWDPSSYNQVLQSENTSYEWLRSDASGDLEKLWEHLKKGKGAILDYRGSDEDYYLGKRSAPWNDKESTELKSRSTVFMPSREPKERSGHAVQVVAAFEQEGWGRMLVVRDSARGDLQLWRWEDLKKAPYNSPVRMALVGGVAENLAGLEKTAAILDRTSYFQNVASFVRGHADEIQPVSFDKLGDPSKLGSWVIIRKKPNVAANDEEVLFGRLRLFWPNEKAVRLERPSMFGSPTKDVFEHEIFEIYEVKPKIEGHATLESLAAQLPKEHATKFNASDFVPSTATELVHATPWGARVVMNYQANMESPSRVVTGHVVGNPEVTGHLEVWDDVAQEALPIYSSELIRSLFVEKNPSWKEAEPSARANALSKISKEFSKANRYVGAVEGAKQAWRVAELVFPSASGFGEFPSSLKKGDQVMLKLRDGRLIDKQNAVYRGLTMVSPNEIHIAGFSLKPSDVESILIFHDAPGPATPLADFIPDHRVDGYLKEPSAEWQSHMKQMKAFTEGVGAFIATHPEKGTPIAIEYQEGPDQFVRKVVGRVESYEKRDGYLAILKVRDENNEIHRIDTGVLVHSIYFLPK